MSFPRKILDEQRSLNEWCILHVYRGSIAHGMYVPNTDPNSIDDKDTMAVCVPSLKYFYGLSQWGSRGTKEIKEGEWDIVVYEIRKVMNLLAGGNPNILSMLWVPENYVISQNSCGRLLRENRDLFLGRHILNPFVGYAKDQIYKMEHLAFEGYMGEKRKRLVEKFGYDCKNAAHAIRLLRMGIEMLRDGVMNVDRGNIDAVELLAIKRGEWSLERVKEEADRLFKRAEFVADRSTLPAQADRKKIEDLCIEIVLRMNG